MCDHFPGLVETSTNIGALKSEGNKIVVESLQRSSNNSARDDLVKTIVSLASLAEAQIDNSGVYPGWEPNISSGILNLVKERYKIQFGKDPEITAIHAGLECGQFKKNYPDLDIISFGPDIFNPHSPDERVNIPSVKRFWDLLLDILENIPETG